MEPMTIEEIKEYLPHRYPFLLLDRIVEWEKDKRIVALKNVTANEPFFQGHFPHYAVMPGVLIIEAMAQAAAMLGLLSLGTEERRQERLLLRRHRRRALQAAGAARGPARDRGRAAAAVARHRQVQGGGAGRRRRSPPRRELLCALRPVAA